MAEYTEAQNQLKEEIEKRRFYTINKSGETDTYVRAYITLKTLYDSGVNRFNRKSREKELRKQMEELDLAGFADRTAEEQEVITDQWTDFAKKYVKLSIKDKSYSRTLFGIVPMKGDTVERKLLTDFTEISVKLPELFDLQNEFGPFYRALMTGYHQALDKD